MGVIDNKYAVMNLANRTRNRNRPRRVLSGSVEISKTATIMDSNQMPTMAKKTIKPGIKNARRLLTGTQRLKTTVDSNDSLDR
jgi:hypothetical protein